MPLAVLEAMGAGTPAVVSGLGGLPELVDHGINGLVVKHNDPTALAAALQRMADNPQSSIDMGRAARAKMLAQFDVTQHQAQIFDYYGEAATVLAGAHRRARTHTMLRATEA